MDPALAARFARQKDLRKPCLFLWHVIWYFDACGVSVFTDSAQEKLERGDDVVEIGSQADHKKQLDPVLAQRWVVPASWIELMRWLQNTSDLLSQAATQSTPGEVANRRSSEVCGERWHWINRSSRAVVTVVFCSCISCYHQVLIRWNRGQDGQIGSCPGQAMVKAAGSSLFWTCGMLWQLVVKSCRSEWMTIMSAKFQMWSRWQTSQRILACLTRPWAFYDSMIFNGFLRKDVFSCLRKQKGRALFQGSQCSYTVLIYWSLSLRTRL